MLAWDHDALEKKFQLLSLIIIWWFSDPDGTYIFIIILSAVEIH